MACLLDKTTIYSINHPNHGPRAILPRISRCSGSVIVHGNVTKRGIRIVYLSLNGGTGDKFAKEGCRMIVSIFSFHQGRDLYERRKSGTCEFWGLCCYKAVQESLYFSNSDEVQRSYLNGGLFRRLKDTEDDKQAVEIAVKSIFSRAPTDEETELLVKYLSAREDRREEGCRQLIWALLTSTEFRFNY